jgi:hypothetical protein
LIGKAPAAFGIWLLASGCVLLALLWNRGTQEDISTNQVARLDGLRADKVWFGTPNTLFARQFRNGELLIHAFDVPLANSGGQTRSVSTGASKPEAVAVDAKASRAYWATGGKLSAADVAGSQGPASVDLPGDGYLIAAGSDDSVVAADAAGVVKVFDGARLKLRGEQKVPIENADTMQTAGPYVAIANRSAGSVCVLDLRSAGLSMVEHRTFPSRLLEVAVSDTGRLAVATESGTILSERSFAAPGLVRAIAFFERDTFLVGGSFPGVHLLQENKPPKIFAQSPAGTLSVAWSAGHIAIAGSSRLEVHAYHYGLNLTEHRNRLLFAWSAVTLILLLASIAYAAYDVWQKLRSERVSSSGSRAPAAAPDAVDKAVIELAEPSAELQRAIASGECIVVVGENLSKQSGIPLWSAFVIGLIEWAADLRYIDDTQSNRMREAHKAGRGDDVAEAMVDRFPDQVLQFAQAMYLKAAPMSIVHEALTGIQLGGAITPNLDRLLERAIGARADELLQHPDIAEIRSRVERKERFLLKIRGDWELPASVTLIPSHGYSRCAEQPEYAGLLRYMLASRTVLFLGMNLEDIRMFLEPANLDKVPERKHYAILPRSGVKASGDPVLQRNGVRCLVHPDGNTEQVCLFLKKLGAVAAERGFSLA